MRVSAAEAAKSQNPLVPRRVFNTQGSDKGTRGAGCWSHFYGCGRAALLLRVCSTVTLADRHAASLRAQALTSQAALFSVPLQDSEIERLAAIETELGTLAQQLHRLQRG